MGANIMRSNTITTVLLGLLFCSWAVGKTPESTLADPSLANFKPMEAPQTRKLVLKQGDRLAICGDSITEQKMYSRIMEDYLTMCVPELEVTVRQYGWSGERAPGFLARMTNDCLRFQPTIATTCYGMNDHEYRPYEPRIGDTYRRISTAIIDAFQANGARVVMGSPGCVGKMPSWVKTASGTVEDLNLNLCTLRNIGIEIARQEKVPFADVFWPMITSGVEAKRRFGADFAMPGKDGVHPDWAGQTVMAYAFLKALGLKGDIGTFTVDLKRSRVRASKGHEVISASGNEFVIRSARYPFCACLNEGQATSHYPVCQNENPTKDNSIRATMSLVPFNQDLNRFMLVARRGTADRYRVTWGQESRVFSAEELARGINLAAAFTATPFAEAFAKVDAAVAAKQAYETKQIKQVFHSAEAKKDMEAAAARTELERAPLAAAIKAAFVPVTHTVKIEAQ
jgi:lysophospholipase L1-like esterase